MENKKSIEEIIKELKEFPKNYTARAYEGEIRALVVEDTKGKEVGHIEC